MAENIIKGSIDIAATTAGVANSIELGTLRGVNLGAQLTGASTTSGDSAWELSQSNDGTNWVAIASTTFTGIGNETLSISVADSFHMLYLGIYKSAAGTETTGTVSINVTVK